MTKPLQIASNFVVMSSNFDADTVDVTDTMYAELDKKYNGFAEHLLIASHTFDDDWPTWEVHPKGDEFVFLVSGNVDMILALDEGDKTVKMSEPNSFIIVPRGIWHTAKVYEPTQMMFVTPGEGTDNRERPVRGVR